MVDPFPQSSSPAYTVSGSAALERVIQHESLHGSRLLVPAFICKRFLRPIVDQYEIEPVFVDVDTETYHLEFDQARPQLPDVDAALFVHAFGLPAPIERWVDHCREHDVVVIEDCARALSARRDGQLVGGFGDYAIFSLSKVAPVFTGGALLTHPERSRLDLAPATISVDLFVKFLYTALPWELPYKNRLSVLYERLIGNRRYVTQDPEWGYQNADETPSVRELDPINRWLFERYLRRTFPHALGRHRSIADSFRTVLETYGFDVQPDAPGRANYVLPATVPGDRDALVDYLCARDTPVQVIWNEPFGLSADQSRADRYPGTQFLAENIITIPIAALTQTEAARLIRNLHAYYRG